MLWLNGVGLAPAPLGSSGTGQRKSYSRRINRDELNNVLWSEGLPQHSTTTEQIQCHMVINIISVFSSASSWLCCLLALYECTNVDAHMYMVYVFMYMVWLMYSALDKSNMHMHHGSEWWVQLILPLATLSLCGGQGLLLPLKAARGWVLSSGITGLKWSQQLFSGQPETQLSLLVPAQATLSLGCVLSLSAVAAWIFVFMSKWTYSPVSVNTACLHKR